MISRAPPPTWALAILSLLLGAGAGAAEPAAPPSPARTVELLSWGCHQGKKLGDCLELAWTLDRLAAQLPPRSHPCRVARRPLPDDDRPGDDWPRPFISECDSQFDPARTVADAFELACGSGVEEACREILPRWPAVLRHKQEPAPVERSTVLESIRRLPALGKIYSFVRFPVVALDGAAGVAWMVSDGAISARALTSGDPVAPPRLLDPAGSSWSVEPRDAVIGDDGQLRVLVKSDGFQIWSPLAGTLLPLRATGSRRVCSAALSRSGRQVAVGLGIPPSGNSDCPARATDTAVEVRDAATGELIWARPIAVSPFRIAVSADGSAVAAAELGPRVALASRDDGRTWRAPKDQKVASLVVAPGGEKVVVAAGQDLSLVDRSSGSARSLGRRSGAAFTPAGDLLLVVGGGRLELARAADGTLLEPPTAFGSPRSDTRDQQAEVVFSADGKTALVLAAGQFPALVRFRGAAALSRPGESVVKAAGALRPVKEPPPPSTEPAVPKPTGPAGPTEWSLTGVVLRGGKPAAGVEVELRVAGRPAVLPFPVSLGKLTVRGAHAYDVKVQNVAGGPERPGETRGEDVVFGGLPAGTYRLRLDKPNVIARHLEVRLGPDEVKTVSSSDLIEPPAITGRVTRLGTGEPVTLAVVATFCAAAIGDADPRIRKRECIAVTGPDGTFELRGVEPGRHLFAVKGPSSVLRELLLDIGPAAGPPLALEVWEPRTFWRGPGAPASPPEPVDLSWPGLVLEEEPGGLRVKKVNGPASTPELRAGDLIVAVNGKPLKGAGRLRFTSELDSPSPPRLEISRGGSKLEAVLAPRPDLGSISSPWWPWR